MEQAFFLHEKGVGEEVHCQYLQLAQSLEEFIGKTFNEWVATVEKELLKHLEQPLMAKCHNRFVCSEHCMLVCMCTLYVYVLCNFNWVFSTALMLNYKGRHIASKLDRDLLLYPTLCRSGMIEDSFSRVLLKLFGEMCYWERLRFEVPLYAAEIYHRCEELRVLRENVLLIVRDYNRIISSLQPKERALFRERIRSLDKKIRPGMTKLTWATEGIEYFVPDCRLHAQKVRVTIESYKAANRAIGARCRKISEMLLVRLDGKRVYEGAEFESEQYNHRVSVQHRLQELHGEIVHTMKRTFEVRGEQSGW